MKHSTLMAASMYGLIASVIIVLNRVTTEIVRHSSLILSTHNSLVTIRYVCSY